MRPLALQLAGFACFKDEQPRVDFEGHDLLAIAGPTGAGKSTLLDAMTFALYGKVPRMGRGGIKELISLGRDRLSVVFDFRLEGTHYRVVRVAHRTRASSAMFETVVTSPGSDGEPTERTKPIADGVRAVDEAVAEVVGLGYDTFVRAVVLPQGEFDQLLRAQAVERRKILVELLRLGVYDKMGKAARRTARELGDTVTNLDTRLAEDYEGITAAARDAAEADLATSGAQRAEIQQQLVEARQGAEALARRYALVVELAEREAERQDLDGQAAEVAAQREQLTNARRAAEVMPFVERHQTAQSAVDTAQSAVETSARRCRDAEAEHQKALRIMADADDEAERAERWRERLRALDQTVGLLEPRERARVSLREAGEALDALDVERRELEASLEPLQREQAAADDRAKAAERTLSDLGWDPARADRLEALRPAVETLARATDALRAAETRMAAHAESMRAAQGALEAAITAHDTAEASRKEASAAAQRALADVEATRRAHRAHLIRLELSPGDRCPVCTQPVGELSDEPVGALEAQEATLASRREALERATAAATAAEVARRTAEAEARTARTTAERLTAEVDTAREAVQAAMSADLLEAASGPKEPAACLAALQEQLTRLGDERRAAMAARDARDTAQRAADAARERAANATMGLASVETRLDAARAHEARTRAEYRHLDEQIVRVTTEPDPQAEREALAKRLDGVLERRDAARDAERQAGQQAELARAEQKRADEDHASAVRARDEAAAAVERVAAEHGFAAVDAMDVVDAVVAAARPAAERERLDRLLAERQARDAAVRVRIAELRAQLGDDPPSSEAVAAAESRVAELAAGQQTLVAREAEQKARLDDLNRRLVAAERLAKQRDEAAAERTIFSRLAHDLRSDQFQAYLIDEIFRALVAGASTRLMALTGRYELQADGDAFVVVDHDNAQQTRSTDTLSGGETFLTSLALALELSEQVQRAAGALRLDSLFIDEGFGSLDPETLDTVASAIETLGATGRLVGVITHVTELTRRLPARIEIVRLPGGSTIEQPSREGEPASAN